MALTNSIILALIMNKVSCIKFLVCLLLVSTTAGGQAFLGVGTFGGISNESVVSVDVDKNGNVLTTGLFADIVDFDPGPGVHYDTSSFTSYNIFIQKFDSNGILQWVNNIGGSNNDQGTSIATDDTGNVYLGALVKGLVDLDPDTGVFLTSSNGGYDFVIIKFDPSGRFVWGHRFGGIVDDWVVQIDVDDSGNVYATGRFSDSLDFDPGPGFDWKYSPPMDDNSFVMKLNRDGSYGWCHDLGSYYGDFGSAVHIAPDGNVLFGGAFNVTVDFDPGPGSDIRTSVDGSDAYLLKLNPAGNFIWVQTFGEQLESITTSNDGSIHITGTFQFTVDFDPGMGVESRTSQGFVDWFVLKLSSGGTFRWVQVFGDNSTSYDVGSCIKVDLAGNVLVCGYFGGTVDFDPGSGSVSHIADDDDAFLLSLDSTGNFNWVNVITGIWSQKALAIDLDSTGVLYEVGWWMRVTDFDPGPGSWLDTAIGNTDDAFIWKGFSCTSVTFGSANIVSCPPYISPSGSSITTSGIYTDVIVNHLGCDSVITLTVTIIPPVNVNLGPNDTICYGDSIQLSPTTGFASYQWSAGNFSSTLPNVTVSPVSSTFYLLTAIDSNGCNDSDVILISVDSIPVATMNNQMQGVGLFDFTCVSSGISPVTYLWDFGDSSFSAIQNPSHQYAVNGTYTVTLVVTNSCGSDTVTQIVVVTGVGIEENGSLPVLSLYPNPANEFLVIDFSPHSTCEMIFISSVDGREVEFGTTALQDNGQLLVELSQFSSGLYFFHVVESNGMHHVIPFVVQ